MQIRCLISRWLMGGFAAFCVNAACANPTVTFSDNAKVVGKTTQNVDSYLGITYAKASRWKRPKLSSPAKGTFQATKSGNICPQKLTGGSVGYEDCLNLNIYRPHNTDKALPVLVYIHGGNNQVGAAREFNPNALAKTLNVIVVQINYRLGALGFNPLKAIKTKDPIQASGNFGLLDQLAALKWVKKHISSFGGDANKVTVSGFSAGGRDVMAMLISPLFKDQFERAIVFSGGMTTAPVVPSQRVFRNAFAPLVVKDHIKPNLAAAKKWLANGGSEVSKYLQKLPVNRLTPLMNNAGIRMSRFPHLYRDGTVIPKEGFATQHYNSVPVIMLTGESEFSFFAISSPHFIKAWNSHTLADNPTLLEQYDFVNYYGGKLYSLFNVQQSAERMHPHYHAPIYGTQVAFGMDPLVTRISSMALIKSFHGIFMPLIDRSLHKKLLKNVFQQPGAVDLSNQFRRYLGNFMRTGNPNGDDLVKWLTWSPKHEEQGQSLLILNANRRKALIQMTSKSYDEGVLLQKMTNDNSLSPQDKKVMINKVLNGRWFSSSLDKNFNTPDLWPKS